MPPAWMLHVLAWGLVAVGLFALVSMSI